MSGPSKTTKAGKRSTRGNATPAKKPRNGSYDEDEIVQLVLSNELEQVAETLESFESERWEGILRRCIQDAKTEELMEFVLNFMKQVEEKLSRASKKNVDAAIMDTVHLSDIEKYNYKVSLSEKLIQVDSEYFHGLIPRLVEKVFKDERFYDPCKKLVVYAQNLKKHNTSQCIVINATFQHLRQGSLLGTEQAMHLWALARHWLESRSSQDMSQDDQKLVDDAYAELTKHRTQYFEIMKSYVEAKNFDRCVERVWTMTSVYKDFVSWYYAQRVENAGNLIAAAGNIFFPGFQGLMLKYIYKEMRNCDHLETFAAFQLYHMVHLKFISPNIDNEDAKYVWGKVPKCLKDILANETFRIVNADSNEPLFYSGDAVYSCVRRTDNENENQVWSATMNSSSLVSFSAGSGKFMRSQAIDEMVDMVPRNDTPGTLWKIKAIDEEHVKIFHSEDEYLTPRIYPRGDDGNRRDVWLRTGFSKSNQSQTWKIEVKSKN